MGARPVKRTTLKKPGDYGITYRTAKIVEAHKVIASRQLAGYTEDGTPIYRVPPGAGSLIEVRLQDREATDDYE